MIGSLIELGKFPAPDMLSPADKSEMIGRIGSLAMTSSRQAGIEAALGPAARTAKRSFGS
jgi:hypothetical protein